MERLTSDYGVIIKWSDYFIETFEYNTNLLTFVDDTGSYLEQDYIFITEKELRCYLESIKPYCATYKIIKTLKDNPNKNIKINS